MLIKSEFGCISRDILQLRNLISEMHRRVDIKPWMIEPLLDYKLDYEKSQTSLSDIASSNGTVSL